MEKAPFLVVEQPYETTVAWIVERLHNLGLQTTITFDLQVARHAHTNCSCPHHGTEQCDCQMVVILVYGQGSKPVSLVVHSHEVSPRWLHGAMATRHGDAITQLSFVDTPQQPINPQLEKLLLRTLTPSVDSFSQAETG